MNDINTVTLTGVLGNDAQFKVFGSGNEIAEMNFGFKTRQKNREGVWTDKSHWIRVKAFKLPDFIKQQLTKGRQLVVNGRLEIDTWEKDGVKKSQAVVMANEVWPMRGRMDDTQVPLTPKAEPAGPNDNPF